MRDCGFDEVRSTRSATWSAATKAPRRARKTLLTGSHYDTVRNGGKYDGRLGIFVPMACVRELHAPGPAPALRLRGGRLRGRGRPALQGHLPRLGRADRPLRPGLAGPAGCRRRHDARGHAARRPAGTLKTSPRCSATRRDYLGFVEVHIEQGPVLNELDLPLGIVTSINGSVRYVVRGDRHGQPRRHHADGPPPRRRLRRGRAGPVRRAARRAGRRFGRHHRHAAGAQRLDQRGARPLPVQPGPARAQRPAARCPGGRRAGRSSKDDLRAPRPALHAGGNHARRRRAQRARMAAALGTARSTRSACRCTACPAAPATTR